MSDFMNEGWSNYITLVSLVGIIWCIWLLFSQRKAKVIHTAEGTVSDTGHVWDGDLRELNNPLPNWWRWMYLIGCLFGLTYLALYPGLGSYSGLLDFTTSKELTTSMEQANQELKPIYAKYSNMSIEQVAVDPKAQEIGQRLFLNSCSQCHGSDAGGSMAVNRRISKQPLRWVVMA
jgi:cytochrome c oxidase cbb3-type subunit III